MTNLPQFLRFDRIELYYQSNGYPSRLTIVKKCQSVVNYLRLLKLNDSSLIHFNGTINKNNPDNFNSHSQLFGHLRNELLPICGSSRGYKFDLFTADEVSRTNLIDQILQMPRIECCSNVEIKLNKIYGSIILSLQLPIESISNWLHRNCDGIKEESKERLLRIYSSGFIFSWGIGALCDHLKKVINGINSFTFFRKFRIILGSIPVFHCNFSLPPLCTFMSYVLGSNCRLTIE